MRLAKKKDAAAGLGQREGLRRLFWPLLIAGIPGIIMIAGLTITRFCLVDWLIHASHAYPQYEVRIDTVGRAVPLMLIGEALFDSKDRLAETWLLAHGEDAARFLACRLGDNDPLIRCRAADRLARLGHEALPVIDPVMKRLVDSDPRVCAALTHTLFAMGAEAVPALSKALTDSEPNIAVGAAIALRYIGPPARPAIPILEKNARHDEHRIYASAVHALVQIGRPAVPALLRLSNHRDPDIRIGVIRGLREAGGTEPGVMDAFIQATVDNAGDVRQEAVKALYARGTESEPFLRAGLQAADPRMRLGCIQAVRKLRRRAAALADALCAAVSDPEAAVRVEAVYGLAAVIPHDPRVPRQCLERLGDEAWLVRRAALEILARDGRVSVGELTLIARRAETDAHWCVRKAAIDTLLILNAERKTVIPVLIHGLADEDATVRYAAAAGIRVLAPAAALYAVRHALAHEPFGFVRDEIENVLPALESAAEALRLDNADLAGRSARQAPIQV